MRRKFNKVASMLTAVTVSVSAEVAPMTSMANTIYENPSGTERDVVSSQDTLEHNNGTVTVNEGTVKENDGTVTTNNKVEDNDNIVSTNNGKRQIEGAWCFNHPSFIIKSG